MYCDLTEEYYGCKVVDFNSAGDWQGPEVAYRLREEYEDETSIQDRLKELLNQSGAKQLTALLIGAWSGACEGDNSKELVEQLVEVAPQLPNLKALFIGDITYEECELSWINQSDLSPVLAAFPGLVEFTVRGGQELSFSRIKHDNLELLTIQTGGLSKSAIREIFQCDFPSLTSLELHLGDAGYGFDASVEDLQPVLSGKLYPKLYYLGLVNSEIADDIAAVVVNSPIVDRIATLDLSQGNLTDTGLRSLHALVGKQNIKNVSIMHHYCSESAVAELQKAAPWTLHAEEAQQADGDWRPILHAE